MIRVLEGGTDAGSMVLFDPAALPDDFDARIGPEASEILGPLTRAGDVFWLDTRSDGAYSLGVRIGEPPLGESAGFARRVEEARRIDAAGGQLYFTGVEYAFRRDDSRLRKYPLMGACCEVPPGAYRLTLDEMHYPEDFHEDLLRRRLSARELRVHSLAYRLIFPLGVFSALGLIFGPFLLGLRPWAIAVLPIGLALILPAVLTVRSRPYRRACEVESAIRLEFPDYWATLEPSPGGSSPAG